MLVYYLNSLKVDLSESLLGIFFPDKLPDRGDASDDSLLPLLEEHETLLFTP